MANFVEIEDDLLLENSPDEIRIIKSPSAVWHAIMFISSIPLAASLVLFITSFNPYYIIVFVMFAVVVAINYSREVIILDLTQKTVQISFVCWKYHVFTKKLILYDNNKFYVTRYRELADDEDFHYVLELDSRKLLTFRSKETYQIFFKTVGHRIKIETSYSN
jgi:hypothetical protein